MYRKGLRATVGGVDRDIPVGVWTSGQGLKYDGTSIVSASSADLNPGGANTLFPGTYAAGDEPRWTGSAWAPKSVQSFELAANTGAIIAITDIAGFVFTLKAGSKYWLDCVLYGTTTGATGVTTLTPTFSSAPTRVRFGATFQTGLTAVSLTSIGGSALTYALVSGGTGALTGSIQTLRGTIVANAATAVQIRATKTTAGDIIYLAGTGGLLTEM